MVLYEKPCGMQSFTRLAVQIVDTCVLTSGAAAVSRVALVVRMPFLETFLQSEEALRERRQRIDRDLMEKHRQLGQLHSNFVSVQKRIDEATKCAIPQNTMNMPPVVPRWLYMTVSFGLPVTLIEQPLTSCFSQAPQARRSGGSSLAVSGLHGPQR